MTTDRAKLLAMCEQIIEGGVYNGYTAEVIARYAKAQIEAGEPRQEVTVEDIIRAICPIVKPWMDDESAKPHACICPEFIQVGDNECGITVCRAVMTRIATALLALLTPPKEP